MCPESGGAHIGGGVGSILHQHEEMSMIESLESLGESHGAQVSEGHAVDVAELKWR